MEEMMLKKKKSLPNWSNILLLVLINAFIGGHGLAQSKSIDKKLDSYLFVYFTGNKIREEAIHFALSSDGYNFKSLNANKPVINSAIISSSGGIRDPHILRGDDGKTFYMVTTDMVSSKGWDSNRAMVLLKSTDLINCKSNVVNIQKKFSGNEDLLRVWDPQTI